MQFDTNAANLRRCGTTIRCHLHSHLNLEDQHSARFPAKLLCGIYVHRKRESYRKRDGHPSVRLTLQLCIVDSTAPDVAACVCGPAAVFRSPRYRTVAVAPDRTSYARGARTPRQPRRHVGGVFTPPPPVLTVVHPLSKLPSLSH